MQNKTGICPTKYEIQTNLTHITYLLLWNIFIVFSLNSHSDDTGLIYNLLNEFSIFSYNFSYGKSTKETYSQRILLG